MVIKLENTMHTHVIQTYPHGYTNGVNSDSFPWKKQRLHQLIYDRSNAIAEEQGNIGTDMFL